MHARRHDVDWTGIDSRVTWIPEPYWSPTVTTATATRILRCTESSFARLVEFGLAHESGPHGPLFDIHDIRNAALYSRSAVTDVERVMGSTFAYMCESPAALTSARTWQYSLEVRLAAAASPSVRVYRPTPEDFDGALLTCLVDRQPVDVHGDQLDLPAQRAVTGTLLTKGVPGSVRSKTARELASDLIRAIRWQYLPPSLEAEPQLAADLGIGTCITMSVLLEQQLCAHGFEARAYRGWCIGALAQHAWVALLDEDGVTKPLDPALAVLATANGFGTPAFASLVLGSSINRVVPTHGRAVTGIVVEPGAPVDIGFGCVPLERNVASTASIETSTVLGDE